MFSCQCYNMVGENNVDATVKPHPGWKHDLIALSRHMVKGSLQYETNLFWYWLIQGAASCINLDILY